MFELLRERGGTRVCAAHVCVVMLYSCTCGWAMQTDRKQWCVCLNRLIPGTALGLSLMTKMAL